MLSEPKFESRDSLPWTLYPDFFFFSFFLGGTFIIIVRKWKKRHQAIHVPPVLFRPDTLCTPESWPTTRKDRRVSPAQTRCHYFGQPSHYSVCNCTFTLTNQPLYWHCTCTSAEDDSNVSAPVTFPTLNIALWVSPQGSSECYHLVWKCWKSTRHHETGWFGHHTKLTWDSRQNALLRSVYCVLVSAVMSLSLRSANQTFGIVLFSLKSLYMWTLSSFDMWLIYSQLKLVDILTKRLQGNFFYFFII